MREKRYPGKLIKVILTLMVSMFHSKPKHTNALGDKKSAQRWLMKSKMGEEMRRNYIELKSQNEKGCRDNYGWEKKVKPLTRDFN
jgi:bisphosphoglycerate-dependent phosphoglycerate mutase